MTDAGPRAARRMRAWGWGIAGFVAVAILTAPPEKRTIENVAAILALNLLLLRGIAALAKRVEQGRAALPAFLVVASYSCLAIAAMSVAHAAYSVTPNFWFAVGAQVVVAVLASRALLALFPLLRDHDA